MARFNTESDPCYTPFESADLKVTVRDSLRENADHLPRLEQLSALLEGGNISSEFGPIIRLAIDWKGSTKTE